MFSLWFGFLCTITAVAHVSPATAEPTYFDNLARTLDETNFYRWVCNERNESVLQVLGTATYPAPSEAQDTYARFVDMVQCHIAAVQRNGLTALCERDIDAWRRIAGRELKKCADRPLGQAARNKVETLRARYDQRQCKTRLVNRNEGPNVGNVLLCICLQPQFQVPTGIAAPRIAVGSARLSTVGSPLGALQEQAVVRECLQGSLVQAEQVCGETPRDFGILAKHLMEACCKRARVNFAAEKLECKTQVPDNVSNLK